MFFMCLRGTPLSVYKKVTEPDELADILINNYVTTTCIRRKIHMLCHPCNYVSFLMTCLFNTKCRPSPLGVSELTSGLKSAAPHLWAPIHSVFPTVRLMSGWVGMIKKKKIWALMKWLVGESWMMLIRVFTHCEINKQGMKTLNRFSMSTKKREAQFTDKSQFQ